MKNELVMGFEPDVEHLILPIVNHKSHVSTIRIRGYIVMCQFYSNK